MTILLFFGMIIRKEGGIITDITTQTMGTTEKVKFLMDRQGLMQKELAEKLGISQQNLSKKMKHNDWRESDLRDIAKILNAELEVNFIMNTGETI